MSPLLRSALAILVASAIVGAPAVAMATVIAETIEFTGTGFTGFAVGPPIDPVIGSVTLAFDDAVAATNIGSGIQLNSLNIALASAIGYDYFPVGSPFFPDELIIGGLVHDVNGIEAAIADFSLVIGGASSKNPTFLELAYSQPSVFQGIYETSTGELAIVSAAIPEPSTLFLFGTSLSLLAVFRRRKALTGTDID